MGICARIAVMVIVVLLIGQAAFAASEIPLAIPKLWLCVHERFLPYLYKR